MKVRLVAGVIAVTVLLPVAVQAQALRSDAGFMTNALARNDDGSTGLVSLGFNIDFFGVQTGQTYVNNNGNITFQNPLSTFTPNPLVNNATQIIAPFWADVDTRNAASAQVHYGQSTVDGRNAFGVDWFEGSVSNPTGVGYYSGLASKLNVFQLVLIDRGDTGAGNFDFEFNYGPMQWEVGQASGDEGDGLCNGNESNPAACHPARVGWSNGSDHSFELAGSNQNGAFVTGGPNELDAHSLNSNVTGRYLFSVRGGQVVDNNPPGTVPEPISATLIGTGMMGLAFLRRRRQKVDA